MIEQSVIGVVKNIFTTDVGLISVDGLATSVVAIVTLLIIAKEIYKKLCKEKIKQNRKLIETGPPTHPSN